MVILGTFNDVSILKSDMGGWKSLVDDQATCRAQLLTDETDRLVVVFKQRSPESKELYRATVTGDMTVKKLSEDFIQIQITNGVIFGVKFKDKDFVNPGKFLVHFRNSEAKVIEQPAPVVQSLAVDQQRPKHTEPVPDFRTTIAPSRRDATDYQERVRNIQPVHQAPPHQTPPHQAPQQNTQNWSGNEQQQLPQMQPMDSGYNNIPPMGGGQRALDGAPNGGTYTGGGAPYGGGGVQHPGGGQFDDQNRHQFGPSPYGVGVAPFGGGGTPRGGAQRQSGELKSPPINQPHYNTGGIQHGGGAQQWEPPAPTTAWGEPRRQPSNEAIPPQSPVKKEAVCKKVSVKTEKQLENYVRLLEAALHDSDKDYTKTIVRLLVEAKRQQGNFSVSFPPTDLNNPKSYFRLKVTIEREIAPREQGILFYLMVTKYFTIEQLKLMIETRFSISPELQHWIIGSRFATDMEARLTDFGLNGRGAEVHLFISKGEVAESSSDADQVIHDDPYRRQQPWSPNQAHDLQYNAVPSPRQWQGGPHVQDQYQPYQNYNNQPMYAHDGTGGSGGGPRFGGNNNFTPEGMIMPPRLPTPPPAQRPATPPPPPGWKCSFCAAINKPYRPGCQLCSTNRPVDYKPPPGYQPTEEEMKWLQDDKLGIQGLEEFERKQKELQERQARQNYEEMMAVARKNLVPNDEEFDCPICFVPIEVGEGVKLRECLHSCCKDCLHDHIMASTDADVLCPCNDQFACGGSITEAEMRELLDDEELDKVHSRGLNLAEGQSRSYHCKTPDCKGWCIYEDDVNEFNCMVCGKKNCLLCKAIHTPQTCKEYQEDLRIKAANDKAAQETQKMIEDMVTNGEAMYCPNQNCGLIIQKKNGCDWIRCSCRTEICWVTKGPRWGPKGKGDTSGGCKCKTRELGGKKCHPKCGNCH